MAKKRKKTRKKASWKFPLLTGGILLANAAAANKFKGLDNKFNEFLLNLTGFNNGNGTWSGARFMRAGAPLLAIVAAKKFGLTRSINRALKMLPVSVS